MLYNYRKVFEKYKNDYNLKQALANKEIYKIAKGLYSDNPSVHHLSVITKKVISGYSAYYYNLTDIISKEITVYTNRNVTIFFKIFYDISYDISCDISYDMI